MARHRRSRTQRFARNVARQEYYEALSAGEDRRTAGYYAHKTRKRAEAAPRRYRQTHTQGGRVRRKYREQKRGGFWGWLFK